MAEVQVAPADPAVIEFHANIEHGDLVAAKDTLTRSHIGNLINSANQKQFTSLMVSVANPTLFAVTKWLLRNGASATYANVETGQTALHLASHANNVQAVMALLRAGALSDVADSHGRTPLHWAALCADPYIAAKLLKYCALQAERRVALGDTGMSLTLPLDPAMARLPRDTLGVYAAQAMLNRQDANGYTALMVAAEHGRVEMVSYLLSRHPDASVRSKIGHSAVELADWYGHTAVRTAIEAYQALQQPPTPTGLSLSGGAAGLLGGQGAGAAPYGLGHGAATPVLSGLGGPSPVPAGPSDAGSVPYGLGSAISRDSAGSAGRTSGTASGPGIGLRSGAIPGGVTGMGSAGSGSMGGPSSMNYTPGPVLAQHGSSSSMTPTVAGLSFGDQRLPAQQANGSAQTQGPFGLGASQAQGAARPGMPGGGMVRGGSGPVGGPLFGMLGQSGPIVGQGPMGVSVGSTGAMGAGRPMVGPGAVPYQPGQGGATQAGGPGAARAGGPGSGSGSNSLHVHTTPVSMGRSLTEVLGFTYPNSSMGHA